jgi:hypothetical protein
MAGGNYYYFSWRRAIISNLRAAWVINRNNQLGFVEIRRDVVPTAYSALGPPIKRLSSTDCHKEFTQEYDFSDKFDARHYPMQSKPKLSNALTEYGR